MPPTVFLKGAVCLPTGRSALSRQQCRRLARVIPGRQRCSVQVTRAALDSEISLAVTQQLVALGFFVGGESAVSFSTMKAGSSGRPSIPLAGAGVAAVIAASQLVGAAGSTGLVAGAAACGGLLVWSAKRVIETKHDPAEWPGPKAWPVSSAVASFFGLVLCLEALAS
mmetsp:Transcript_19245/g.53667  ORF Transcript_19245/g.53667 Transcript_19245/m.53667 type:complete len:168 (-) Transcript_19245:208-711(-)|eukprot:CAMPEP_0117668306 /NCGR_PEP_ID=MMETSP0804-20121206/11471_1 /TAXON_ID=1074897 /ORGANISM="Tetraselmis astigmatica, Strain CCMP880" /LENGTH=167 /DNA_ID=CAMNT_0005476173 /DNA_START=116 /DNA_END=619 /DNA_ORIENTATION=-